MRKEYSVSNLKDNLIDIINDFGSISTDFPLHVVGDWFTINSWKGYAFSKQCQVLLLSYIIEDKYNIKIRAIQYGDFIGFQIYEDGNINVSNTDISAGSYVVVSDNAQANQSDFVRLGGYDALQYVQNFAYYFPMPILCTKCSKLVINYDEETHTVMFSTLLPFHYNYSSFTHTQYMTHSMCFGVVTQRGSWMEDTRSVNQGFWWGGDSVGCFEIYMKAQIMSPHPPIRRMGKCPNDGPDAPTRVISTTTYSNWTQYYTGGFGWVFEADVGHAIDSHKSISYCGGEGSLQPWYDSLGSIDRYSSYPKYSPDTINRYNRFEAFLIIDMDNYPDRHSKDAVPYPYKGDVHEYFPVLNCFYNIITTVTNECSGEKNSTWHYSDPIPQIVRKGSHVATTVRLNNVLSQYYPPMVVSIDDKSKGLPSYWPEFTNDKFGDNSSTVNDLNKLSLIFRLYFMVHRDPLELENYSCVGYTDVVNYVNMKYMSTNSMVDSTYPVKKPIYNCFQTGIRRSDLGFKGFAGLAFKVSDTQSIDVDDGNSGKEEDN